MLFKIHPDFDRLLGDLLERDPDGIVVLFDAPGDLRAMRESLLARLRRSNRERVGVLNRLRVLPRLPLRRYLGLMQLAEVVLDTTPSIGRNTHIHHTRKPSCWERV